MPLAKIWLSVVVLTCSIHAQTPTLKIQFDRDFKTVPGLSGGPLINPIRCDDHNNVYLRRYIPRRSTLQSPLAKIILTTDQPKFVTFSPDRATDPKLKESLIYDFAIRGSDVYLLCLSADTKSKDAKKANTKGADTEVVETKVNILRYSDDGEYKNAVSLDRDIHPSRLGVFPSGEFLVIGTKTLTDKPKSDKDYSAATEIYDLSGRFIKPVTFRVGEFGLNKKGSSIAEKMESVGLAQVESGPDGVYLLSYSAQPTLFVISSAGEVERRLRLSTPGKEFKPASLRVSSGRIMVEFVNQPESGNGIFYYVVYDSYTGDQIARYEAEGPSGIFCCYDWNVGFTFLSSESNGQRVIRYARAR
jgi:hypothetical protein